MSTQAGPFLRSEVAAVMDLREVRYSQVSEDHFLIEEALRIGPDDDLLSIASGGDNVLALLLQGPRSLTAIDMSPAQAALLELKLAGIRRLDHTEFVSFMGAREDKGRSMLYARLRDGLPATARAFWDSRPAQIEAGVLHCGRLERYFRLFRETYLPSVWPAGLAHRLMEAPDLATQERTFEEDAATPAFRELVSWFFGQETMAEHGRDRAQLRHVQATDFGAHFMTRLRHVSTRLPLRGNFYFEYLFTGRYRDLAAGPPYLRPHTFARLKDLLERVTVVTDELERFLTASPPLAFSKANLSDVFEYMSEELSERVLAALASRLRPGGRLAYWNLFVPRSRPESLRAILRRDPGLGRDLWQRDRCPFYSAFQVEEVLP